MYCEQRVSGITFIRYTQNLKIGKPNNLKVLGAIQSKGLNRITKIGKGHLCLSEENLSLINIYII
jgi:hypothetical protein